MIRIKLAFDQKHQLIDVKTEEDGAKPLERAFLEDLQKLCKEYLEKMTDPLEFAKPMGLIKETKQIK